jgi:hypothetical protein
MQCGPEWKADLKVRLYVAQETAAPLIVFDQTIT